jgi:hypothetical protein
MLFSLVLDWERAGVRGCIGEIAAPGMDGGMGHR